MAEITRRIGSGVFPVAGDVGTSIGTTDTTLTLPSGAAGVLTSISARAADWPTCTVAEENGRRFIQNTAPETGNNWSSYITVTAESAVRASGQVEFDFRIRDWDSALNALMVPGGTYAAGMQASNISPAFFVSTNAYNSAPGSLNLMCLPFRGKLHPWVYRGREVTGQPFPQAPLPEGITDGEWHHCVIRLLDWQGARHMCLDVDGVSVLAMPVGSAASGGMNSLTLFSPTFKSSSWGTGLTAPYGQIANVEYTYIGTGTADAPAVTASAEVGDTAAVLTAHVRI